jgi:ferredoxin-type protein NapH
MRQKLRNAILIASLLAFPITLDFFSPYLSLNGAARGIISGSLALFALLFVSSLFLGRAFCGWLCMGGCLQDVAMKVNPRRRIRGHWVKFLIWVPWFSAILALAARAGGFKRFEPLFMMDSPISVSEPGNYIVYYSVLTLIVGLAFASGRHAFCHYSCWMAPFMMAGRKLRNMAGWPALQLRARPEKCRDCLTCTQNCPMSIDVHTRVKKSDMEDADCVLCGQCIDNCKQKAIAYSFGKRRGGQVRPGRSAKQNQSLQGRGSRAPRPGLYTGCLSGDGAGAGGRLATREPPNQPKQ